jgi:sulfur carrier protein
MHDLEVFVNGERVRTHATNLQALLLERGYALDGAFACAVNNTFVARRVWTECGLNATDRVDVIAPITGG